MTVLAQPAPAARIVASPLARRSARDAGLDLASVQGSGPAGRIVEADVRAALAARARAPASLPPPTVTAAASAADIRAQYTAGTYVEMPLDAMRRTIARRITASKQSVPHFYLSIDCRLDALRSVRDHLNAAAPAGEDGTPAYRISINDFVVKALAAALQRVPAANVVWADDAILRFDHSDVGVAVAVEGGLFTPVVRRAETKALATISAEVKAFSRRARERRLAPEDYAGGTTTVSNLGMFGVNSFQAVINPPQATILAVGAGEPRIAAGDGKPAVVEMMTVNLSCDHRAVDGATGAELLAAFKRYIEMPMLMIA